MRRRGRADLPRSIGGRPRDGPPRSFNSASAAGWVGERTATVSSPALTKSDSPGGSVPRRKEFPGLSLLVSADLDTVALRAPSHPAAIALLGETGRPVAGLCGIDPAKSPPPLRRMSTESLKGKLDWILDAGGASPGRQIHSEVGFDGGQALLLRPGAIPREEMEDLIGLLGAPGSLIPVRPASCPAIMRRAPA